jgi:hypothetical protein
VVLWSLQRRRKQQLILGACMLPQGKFSNLRRNYSSIWRQMTTRLPQINDPQVGGGGVGCVCEAGSY